MKKVYFAANLPPHVKELNSFFMQSYPTVNKAMFNTLAEQYLNFTNGDVSVDSLKALNQSVSDLVAATNAEIINTYLLTLDGKIKSHDRQIGVRQ